MDKPSPEQFEMRRLESLSNTIFGVAMTLLAYDLPRATEFGHAPGWAELYHLYAPRLIALVLSFVIAGVFWVSHQRRLARQPHAGRAVVLINLGFLLLIILLPVSNGLYGNYGASSAVAVLYGLHLTAIAAVNAWLWWIATRGQPARPELAGALFPLLLLLSGTLLATVAPQYAQYLWLLAFGGVLAHRFVGDRTVA
ncbi:TMEM175 family protein [Bradyrhizobium sp. STM 3562]|uniref:TMEM175 family protein n=1 Tax=Bradyrhizobium sp. STM 3562 TaxID=578924 RepID=UPI00388F15E4